MRHLRRMSLAEMKEKLQTLSLADRLSLEEYLHVLNRIDDPEVQREVNEAMARMDAGQKVTSAELGRLLAEQEA